MGKKHTEKMLKRYGKPPWVMNMARKALNSRKLKKPTDQTRTDSQLGSEEESGERNENIVSS